MAYPSENERGTTGRGVGDKEGTAKDVISFSEFLKQVSEYLDVKPTIPHYTQPLADPEYIDNAATAISIQGRVYLIHVNRGERHLTLSLPEDWIVRQHDMPTTLNKSKVYLTRQAAFEGLVPLVFSLGRHTSVLAGLWRNESSRFIIPTAFSDITTPRIMSAIEAKDEQMRRALLVAIKDLEGILISLVVGKALGTLIGTLLKPQNFDRLESLYRTIRSKRVLPSIMPVRNSSSNTITDAPLFTVKSEVERSVSLTADKRMVSNVVTSEQPRPSNMVTDRGVAENSTAASYWLVGREVSTTATPHLGDPIFLQPPSLKYPSSKFNSLKQSMSGGSVRTTPNITAIERETTTDVTQQRMLNKTIRRKTSVSLSNRQLETIKQLPKNANAIIQKSLGNSGQNIEIFWSSGNDIVFLTPAGQLVGSHKALTTFAKTYTFNGQIPYKGWHSHHIIEEIHLNNLGIRDLFPVRDDLPCVLLPKEAHTERLRSMLGPSDSNKALARASDTYTQELATEAKLLYDDYKQAYGMTGAYTGMGTQKQIKGELLSIVKSMLGF